MKQLIRERLRSSRTYPMIQFAYLAAFNRPWLAHLQRVKRFYRQFVKGGDLVFDIGANKGEHTEVLISLGARVVAVEPNQECVRVLQRTSQRANLSVEAAAVGNAPGTATLHLARESEVATISKEWMSKVHSSLYDWHGTVEVPVTTLDALAEKYGAPAFVKIDIEGFEDRALAGMSFAPAAMTFEFHVDFLEALIRCFNLPILREYSFNFMVAEDYAYRMGDWQTDPAVIVSAIENMGQEAHYGDIICRRH